MPDFNLSLNPLSLNPEDPLIKHAFRGTSFAVVRLEELNEIVNLKTDAVACYRPANSQELFAVERIALSQQAIFRGYRLEAGLFTTALDYCLEGSGRTFRPMQPDMVGDGDIEITRAQNRNYAAGEGFRTMSIESDVWQLLIRYQVNADRQYRRAIEDYERVKRLRPEMPNQPADPKLAPKPENIGDDLASFTELGHSYLDHQPPVTPEPPPPSGHSQAPPPAVAVTPEPLPFTKPSSDFTPAAYVRRATVEPETSPLKIVPISSFLPEHSRAFSTAPAANAVRPAGVTKGEPQVRNHGCCVNFSGDDGQPSAHHGKTPDIFGTSHSGGARDVFAARHGCHHARNRRGGRRQRGHAFPALREQGPVALCGGGGSGTGRV